MNKLSYTIFILLWPLLSVAQVKELSIGDTIPAKYQATLPQGKPVIIDFFATWCTACIRSLPKLDSLQQQFNGELQIILVASEASDKIEAFRKKNKVFANCKFPLIAGDTIFRKLFRHKLIPHTVCISKEGIVKAITDDKAITATAIHDLINDKPLQVAFKKDVLDFDYHLPLPQENVLYRSLLIPQMEGIGGKQGMIYNKDSTTKRFFYTNRPMHVLYALAGVKGKEPTGGELYCYELTVPASFTNEQAKRIMRADLDRYFFKQGF